MVRSGRSGLVGGGLAALWLSAAALPAQAQPASYVVHRVTALGGHAVRGIESGVLFERPLTDGCAGSPPPRARSWAASPGGPPLRLQVEIAACPPAAAPPAVLCKVAVRDRRSPDSPGEVSERSFTGWQAELPVALPAALGVYDLQLQCSVAGRGERIEGTLYRTYAPPRAPVDPPREEWYRLASELAAGLAGEASEAQVLDGLLRQLYDTGQRRWRYGYCTIAGSTCGFGDTTLPVDSPLLVPATPQLKKCRWPVVAAGDAECNFTDCFGFAAMFRYLAATQGIGDLADLQVAGIRGLGFAAQGWLRSLDPQALGNLQCGYRSLQCAFLFGVHDLSEREGRIYDSTFGRIYDNLGQLLAASILAQTDGTVILTRSIACFVIGAPYGGFPPLREYPLGTVGCPQEAGSPGEFLESPGARAEAAVDVGLEALVGDETAAVIKVRLTVRVAAAGDYLVHGVLLGGPNADTVAVNRPLPRSQVPASLFYFSGPPGDYPVTLWFSAEELRASGVPGPYRISAVVVSANGIADELRQPLPPLDVEELGQPAARFGTAAPRTERPTGTEGPVLRVRLPAAVKSAGLYAVDARLSSGGATIAYGGQRRRLAAGEVELAVDFPAAAIARRGVNGLYDLRVELHRLDSATGDPLYLVDSLAAKVGPFRAADFAVR